MRRESFNRLGKVLRPPRVSSQHTGIGWGKRFAPHMLAVSTRALCPPSRLISASPCGDGGRRWAARRVTQSPGVQRPRALSRPWRSLAQLPGDPEAVKEGLEAPLLTVRSLCLRTGSARPSPWVAALP